jgi:hypothetical protein
MELKLGEYQLMLRAQLPLWTGTYRRWKVMVFRVQVPLWSPAEAPLRCQILQFVQTCAVFAVAGRSPRRDNGFVLCQVCVLVIIIIITITPRLQSASELYRPSDHCLSAKLVPTFADRRCRVVSATDPYGRILRFLDRSRYFISQEALHLYSRGCVDPVPDPSFLGKSGNAGNRTRTSGSVTRNSDHQTTEAVHCHHKFSYWQMYTKL